MKYALLDTSVMVAFFDIKEERHALYTTKMRAAQAQSRVLVTTWPCISEASYILSPSGHFALLDWIAAGGALVNDIEIAELPNMVKYMQTYTEPGKSLADLADVSLVWLGQKLDCTHILTEEGIDALTLYHDATLSSFNSLKKAGVAMGLPASVLIDGRGCMLGALNGPAAWESDDANALIRAAMGGV